MESINSKFYERKRIFKLLETVENYKIIYISAICGSGKTTVIKQYEKYLNLEFMWINCNEKFNNDKYNVINNYKYIVLDNFELLDKNQLEKLVNFIENTQNKKFIILSRCIMPREFLKLKYAGVIVEIFQEDLMFDKQEIQDLLKINGSMLSEHIIEEIYNYSFGYPVSINYLVSNCNKIENNKEILSKVKINTMNYIDYFLFNKISSETLIFLIKISLIKDITVTKVNHILKIKNGKELLDDIEKIDSIIKKDVGEIYKIPEIIKVMLEEKAKSELTENELKVILKSCGEYYEKEEPNLLYAVEYYILSKDYEKAVQILSNKNIQHLGIINYSEIEQYILKIPKNIIERSPYLCINLAHMYRLNEQDIEAEYWYEKFNKILLSKKSDKAEYLKLYQMLIYYKICKETTNDIKLADYIKLLGNLNLMTNQIKDITITGNMPSILNGGKDLSNWARHYKIIYKVLNPIIVKAFNDKQEGSAEIAIAEVLYQNDRILDSIKYITKGMSLNKNIDNMFVAYSLLDKIEILNGTEIGSKINYFEKKIIEEKAYYLMKNYEARKLENDIIVGNLENCKKWIDRNKLDILNEFNILERYRYIVKIKALITIEDYTEALIILERLNQYIEKHDRLIYKIQYLILKSICLYKLGQIKQSVINIKKAILLAQKNRYVRLFADEGQIIYEILNEHDEIKNDKKINVKFIDDVKNKAKEFGEKYPNKYQTKFEVITDLTSKEKEIFNLIKQGYTNKEIANKLYISLSTVKTHISHIYSKLGTKNRIQTINKI